MSPEEKREYNRKWYQENKERIRPQRKANTKEYYKKNTERMKGTAKVWKAANKKKCAEYSREWAEANPERRAEILKKSREKHPEVTNLAHRAGNIKWAKANPEKVKAHAITRIQRKFLIENGGTLPPCLCCGSEEDLHQHHGDYDKPYETDVICGKCHRKLHKDGRLECRYGVILEYND